MKDENSESEVSTPLKKKKPNGNVKTKTTNIKAEEIDEGVDTAFDDAADEDDETVMADAEEAAAGGEEVLA